MPFFKFQIYRAGQNMSLKMMLIMLCNVHLFCILLLPETHYFKHTLHITND